MGKPRIRNAKRTEQDGYVFDSLRELTRYSELKLLAQAGEIRDLEVHPKYFLQVGDRPILIRSKGYPNGRRTSYTPDFEYYVRRVAGKVGKQTVTWERVIEDVKGHDTYEMRFKRAVFECIHNVEVKLI